MSAEMTFRDTWQRAQRGWPERFPLAQFPNAPLLIAFAGALVAMVTTGTVHDYGRATFYTGLAAWAWLEVTAGSNWFRRVLGVAGFVYVIAKVGAALGA
jgi:hypothetical protein